jgi:hypothetical protein
MSLKDRELITNHHETPYDTQTYVSVMATYGNRDILSTPATMALKICTVIEQSLIPKLTFVQNSYTISNAV